MLIAQNKFNTQKNCVLSMGMGMIQKKCVLVFANGYWQVYILNKQFFWESHPYLKYNTQTFVYRIQFCVWVLYIPKHKTQTRVYECLLVLTIILIE